MFCRECGNKTASRADICLNCGCQPLAADKHCQSCGATTKANQELCVECCTILSNMKTKEDTPYAGFWLRAGAYFIDSIILTVSGLIIWFLFLLFLVLLSAVLGETGAITAVFLYFGLYFNLIAVSIAYLVIMNASKWQGTIGKIAVGIKIVDMEGNRLTLEKSVLRYLALLVSGVTMGIGFIIAAFTEKKQSLHDMLANTLVIKK